MNYLLCKQCIVGIMVSVVMSFLLMVVVDMNWVFVFMGIVDVVGVIDLENCKVMLFIGGILNIYGLVLILDGWYLVVGSLLVYDCQKLVSCFEGILEDEYVVYYGGGKFIELEVGSMGLFYLVNMVIKMIDCKFEVLGFVYYVLVIFNGCYVVFMYFVSGSISVVDLDFGQLVKIVVMGLVFNYLV